MSATRLLPVIILLLCSCVVCAQMPTEFTINPNITDIEKPEVEKNKNKKKQKKQKKRILRQQKAV